mgnify:CR=1 FL=1
MKNEIKEQEKEELLNNDEYRNQLELKAAIEKADSIILKKYQYDLTSYPIVTPSEELNTLEISKYTRLFKIESIAYDKEENNLIRLSNVYNAMSAVKGSLILIIDKN